MEATRPTLLANSIEKWFEHRSYDHSRFADLARLERIKRELGFSLSVVLPAREVAHTIGATVGEVGTLGGLVDEILVIDAGSSDGSAEIAARHGAEVLPGRASCCRSSAPLRGKGRRRCGGRCRSRRGDVDRLPGLPTRLDFGGHFVSRRARPALLRVPGCSGS